MSKIREWLKRVDEPLIADRSIDLAAVLTWLCFAGWGIATGIAGLRTISELTSQWYELAWGSSIGALALIACIAAFSTFFNNPNLLVRIRKKTFEFWSVSIMAGFISVYPIFAFIQALSGDGNRVALVFVAVSYLIFPVWRVRHLSKRIKRLRDTLTEEANTKDDG